MSGRCQADQCNARSGTSRPKSGPSLAQHSSLPTSAYAGIISANWEGE
jgi:hypothetical protein